MSGDQKEGVGDTQGVDTPWSSLVEMLRERARDQAHDTAFIYLKDGEVEEMSLTYAELEKRARAIAAHLQKEAQPGERALLLFPAGLDYVCAFFGCLFAGVIAVPIYPPQSQRSRVGRLQSVIADSGASWLLAGTEILASLQADSGFDALLGGLHSLATDTLGEEVANQWRAPDVGRSTVAFLQYTSGSTGTAKGVVVSHGNLLSNEALIGEGFATKSSDVVVGWLPLYHDMGLVGNVLQPIFLGAKAVLMSPMAFLQKPIRWLEAISKYRGTVSGGPNFAYELCAERVTGEQLNGLDLSSWRVAFNGSEPIRATTLARFSAAFAGVGFCETAFFPCYGLAESTLFVSGAEPSEVPVYLDVDPAALQRHVVAQPAVDAGRRLVGSGRADLSRISIVSPADGRRCAADEVGEIWIRGASVAQGYWQRAETSKEIFQAHTCEGEGPFLRTGDYGFVRDGELFVTGRLKELIIIRGRNHYPQDIEQTIQASHPALTIGAGAAFSVDVDGEERLVIVQEVQRTHLRRLDVAEVARSVRIAVSEQHELQLHALALIKPMRLPKTSSGKIKRREARSLFLDGELELLAETAAPPVTVSMTVPIAAVTLPARGVLAALPAPERGAMLLSYLQQLLADVLRVPAGSVDVDEALTAQGLDSLAAIQLQHRLESDAQLDCPLELLLAGPSPRVLAGSLAATTLQPLSAALAPSGSSCGPLSWNQESMWFLQSMAPHSSTYNLAVPLRIRSLLSAAQLEQAWTVLAQRHPMLHTHFDGSKEVLYQQIDAAAAPVIEWLDAEGWSDERQQQAMAQAAKRSLLRDSAAPVQVLIYRRGPSDHTLLLLAHHIAVDLQTLVLLLRQLGEIYTDLAEGTSPASGSTAHTTIDFALWQRALVASESGARQWEYWREQLSGELPILTLPTDRPRPRLRDNVGAAVDFAIGAQLSDQLRSLARTQGVTLYMLLLAAYQLFLHKYCGDETICVGSPVTGRSCAAFDALAGYCVNTVVMRAELSDNPRFDNVLAQVRERVLGALANQDLPFACLVERLVPQRDPAITPLFQTLFSLQQTPDLPAASAFVLGEPGARVELGALIVESVALPPQTCQFDLSLFVTDGVTGLRARFEYAASLFDSARIQNMAQHFCHLLAGIVAAPQAKLSQLSLLSRPQTVDLLLQGHGRVEERKPESLVQMVAQQAIASPHVTALICAEQRLDYIELERAAQTLADALCTRGIGQGDRIGLCLPRDTRAFVALLAVLKTGAAYVPLDPAYPPSRLHAIMQLARLQLVIADLHAALPSTAPVLRLDASGNTVATQADATSDSIFDSRDRAAVVQPDDPALPIYLIYTSGSTGAPKGVAMGQGALVNLLRWQQQTMPLTSGTPGQSVCLDQFRRLFPGNFFHLDRRCHAGSCRGRAAA